MRWRDVASDVASPRGLRFHGLAEEDDECEDWESCCSSSEAGSESFRLWPDPYDEGTEASSAPRTAAICRRCFRTTWGESVSLGCRWLRFGPTPTPSCIAEQQVFDTSGLQWQAGSLSIGLKVVCLSQPPAASDSDEAEGAPLKGDFRCAPPSYWQRLYAQFQAAEPAEPWPMEVPAEVRAPRPVPQGDFRCCPDSYWAAFHQRVRPAVRRPGGPGQTGGEHGGARRSFAFFHVGMATHLPVIRPESPEFPTVARSRASSGAALAPLAPPCQPRGSLQNVASCPHLPAAKGARKRDEEERDNLHHSASQNRRQRSMAQRDWLKRSREEEDTAFWGSKGKEGFRTFLQKKFGGILKGWRAVDSQGSGRLGFHEFCHACRAVGFHGNFKKLWAELDEKDTGSVSLMDVDGEVGHYLGHLDGSHLQIGLAGSGAPLQIGLST
eukprot:g25734.t1